MHAYAAAASHFFLRVVGALKGHREVNHFARTLLSVLHKKDSIDLTKS